MKFGVPNKKKWLSCSPHKRDRLVAVPFSQRKEIGYIRKEGETLLQCPKCEKYFIVREQSLEEPSCTIKTCARQVRFYEYGNEYPDYWLCAEHKHKLDPQRKKKKEKGGKQ